MSVRWRVWIALWAGWTGLALFLAAGASLTYLSTGRPANWRLTIAMALAEWWVWAALTPLVAWLCRRWPIRWLARWPLHGLWPPTPILVHVAAGVLIAFAKTVVDRQLRGLITGFFPYFLISTVTFQFIIYWVIVIVIHAADSLRRERERERTAAQLETSLAEARLELLRAQLHPHFLFNTLNAIAEFVHESPSKADRLITALGDLLREATGGRQEIALAAELELLRRYVEIQQARFEDRLELRLECDPAALEARVPSFLLQPIVENSIRHGLSSQLARPPHGQERRATIAIQARRAGDRLRIEVRDSGAGLPDEGAREGFGLGSTRARLQALYGDRARIEVRNALHADADADADAGAGLDAGGGGEARDGTSTSAAFGDDEDSSGRTETGAGPNTGALVRIDMPFAAVAPGDRADVVANADRR